MTGWVIAAFLGGMVFAIAVAVGSIWWLSRGTDAGLDECPHCDGTGLAPAAPMTPEAHP